MQMKMHFARALIISLGVPLAASTAQAASLSAPDFLQRFNRGSFGNGPSTSHVDGCSYVGGSVPASNFDTVQFSLGEIRFAEFMGQLPGGHSEPEPTLPALLLAAVLAAASLRDRGSF
jgi:hypothetical protein